MKKFIKKVGLVIMALTTIKMNACSRLNDDISKEVCDKLSEKYGKSFTAVQIGDRFNTSYAKLYVHPEDNKELLFTAIIDRETREVDDDYIIQIVNSEVEDIIIKCFSDERITVSASSMVVTTEPFEAEKGEYTPATFCEKYDFDSYTIYLVVDSENVSAERILSAFADANKEIGAKLLVAGYVFNSDNYNECSAKMNSVPEISFTMIEKYLPLSSFDIVVDDGICSLNIEQLEKKLDRS